jgi:hypothetical protein
LSGVEPAATMRAMRRLWRRCKCGVVMVGWVLAVAAARAAAADADACAICGGPLVEVYYSLEDKVTLERKHICKDCERTYPVCFVCGLPARTNAPGFAQLPDQRVLCGRDARSAVLDEGEGRRVCREVRDGLDRMFSRFTVFPDTNVTVGLVDRVHLAEMFKLLGNDYQCPNVWGLTETRTNGQQLSYRISILSGLPLDWFQATSAHEYAHAWMGDHVTAARRQSLSRDAEEGFCELVSYLYMESQNDRAQTALILRNAYTRGQIDLFVEAERSYGFNEILDWMQFGLDDRLSAAEPGRVRNITSLFGRSRAPGATWAGGSTPKVPDRLVLKAIIWDEKRPLALVNDRTLALNEEARVRVGNTNLLVRCVGITSGAVRLRVAGSDRDETLTLPSK